jgi:hypothetical protein
MKPDASAQFRTDQPGRERVYMGGTAMSCGMHPSLPKRHRWSKVREYRTSRGVYRDRMCLTCALTKGADENGRDR